MPYEPREGVDYVIDLYALTGVPNDVAPDDLKTLLNQRALEYYPDRLEGLAPEFRQRGEHMARLLNRARRVLLDDTSRAEYDQILSEWKGAISTDGTPIINVDTYLQGEMASKSPEEIEDIFGKQKDKLEGMLGFSPSRLGFLERMVQQSGDNVPEDLRIEYEAGLLEYDRVLAIQEAERSRLLGIDVKKRRYEASFDYGDKVAVEIEVARVTKQAELEALTVGSFSTRLALLAGEDTTSGDDTLPVTPLVLKLPAFFDQQSGKVHEIAKERESILLRRLANFEPEFPEPEIQQEAKPDFVIGIIDDTTTWIAMHYDSESDSANSINLDEQINSLLESGNIPEVIQRGFNVITFKQMEQIDLFTVINAAIDKYLSKYGLKSD